MTAIAEPVAPTLAPAVPRFAWIVGPRHDAALYVGSTLAGWVYVAIVLYAAATLASPRTDVLATLRLGGIEVPLTLQLLVISTWAMILDAPHLFATLARTFFDPDEWRARGRTLLVSLAWFLAGPALVLGPVLLGAALGAAGRPLPRAAIDAGPVAFVALFQVWTYHHVARQHWGFVALYRRKAGERTGERRDFWAVHLAIWLPALINLAGPAPAPSLPSGWLHAPIAGGPAAGDLLRPALVAAYAASLAVLFGAPLLAHLRGERVNGAKLLYLASHLALYAAVFLTHPLLAAFVPPIINGTHNLQYHAIVWAYGRKKYAPGAAAAAEPRLCVARAIFSHVAVYAVCALAFTFALLRGRWVSWVRDHGGGVLDTTLLDSIGMLAGLNAPADLGLGARTIAALLLGWAMQHYYLDARIWRVGRDADVRKSLGVAEEAPATSPA